VSTATAAPTVQERPRVALVQLGDQQVTLTRLKTRDGLSVAHTLLRYISDLREPIAAAFAGRDPTTLDASEAMQIALDILPVLTDLLKEEELLKLLCRLLGQPPDIVGDAPLEDSVNAVAEALKINDMPALLRAVTAIWQEAQRIGRGE